eukprot:3783795-Rhodomonas_salina.2
MSATQTHPIVGGKSQLLGAEAEIYEGNGCLFCGGESGGPFGLRSSSPVCPYALVGTGHAVGRA